MKKKELLSKIEELESTVQRLRSSMDMQDVLIRQFEEREQQVIDTAVSLSEKTDRILSEAKENASDLIEKATDQASKIIMDAKMESARMLSEAETAVSGYRDVIRQYSHALERAASDASANARVFAQFAKKQMHQFDARDFREETERVAPAEKDTHPDFEDSSEDPGAVMRNIYRLQNRDIPDAFFPDTEDETPSEPEDPAGTDLFDGSDSVSETRETDEKEELASLIDEILNTGDTNSNG